MTVRELIHELTADYIDLDAEVRILAAPDYPDLRITDTRAHHSYLDIECEATR